MSIIVSARAPIAAAPLVDQPVDHHPLDQIRPRRFGAAFMGEPYTRWGNQPLVCTIRRLAPAHTVVLFE